ncbi:MAG TPA: type II secretion system protein [Candidatus Saccharimonadales bacterium]|nr:type II secretion system protein [Candidatus Saccharimonadales bacterium]
MVLRKKQSGFTLVELLIVIVVIGILATLVITTYTGIQQKARNTKRQTDINAIQGQLEAYFAQQGKYPTLANMQDRTWIQGNLKGLDLNALQDPKWSTSLSCKDSSNAAELITGTGGSDGCYQYDVQNDSAGTCDNSTSDCTKYTLTAKYEGGGTYTKSSLN